MKKNLIIISAIFLLIIITLTIMLINIQNENRLLQQVNIEYEYYLNKEVYGTDVITLINKAINNNKKYKIETDEDGFYIEDSKYSMKIYVKMLQTEEIYEMEKIFAVGTENFIQLFNSSVFKSVEVKYHSDTKRISKIVFEQIKE